MMIDLENIFPSVHLMKRVSFFSALDEQVMKFGSLQHDTIDWRDYFTFSSVFV